MPRDPRGIVLACGFAGAAVVGVAVLIAPGDPLGFGYLLLALVGYFFLQTRFVPAFFWLLIAAFGAWSAVSGAPVNWIEAVLGLVLAGVAVLSVPAEYREDFAPAMPSDGSASTGPTEPSQGFPTETSPAAGLATRDATAEPESPARTVDQAPEHRPRLQGIGHFRFEVSGRDVASPLEDKPVLSFLFKYLLARYALGDPKVGRTAIGDELTPGVAETSQRERLRKQLYDLQRDVGPELGSLIRSNRSHVWLDLSEGDSDISALRRISEQVRKNGSLISSQMAAEIENFLTKTEGQEFLAGFEELENRVNQGRGTAGETVRQARLAIADQSGELIRALAEYHDALGRPEAAIPYLRSGLDALPDRKDLARLLVTAYLKTGQTTRASELRSQFALAKE